MEVKVINSLTRVRALVDDEPVPAVGDAPFLREPIRDLEHPAQETIVVQVRDGLDVSPRQDQEVNRRLGVDVVEDGDVVIPIDGLGVIALDQAAEDAVRQMTSSN
jgi:hypothetical protein